jgi:RimJ/RimL family protein N-acetyltransferase
MTTMTEIETDRLVLRRFTLDDLDDLSVIFSDPEVVKYLGTGQPAKRAETEYALHTMLNHWERHGFGRWAVTCKQTRALIGYGGLRNFHNTPELVYLLAKRFWGKGLATELASAALKYGFEELGFERIVAMARLANTASQRVLEKVRMSFEKMARISDMEIVCYSITSADYLSGQTANQGEHQLPAANLDSTSDDPHHHRQPAPFAPPSPAKMIA